MRRSTRHPFGIRDLSRAQSAAAAEHSAKGARSGSSRLHRPEEFDEGINAGLLNYSVNASQSHARQQGEENSSSQYVNLRPGFNIGAWRVRNYSTWNRSTTGHEEEQKFTSVYTYAQRDIWR